MDSLACRCSLPSTIYCRGEPRRREPTCRHYERQPFQGRMLTWRELDDNAPTARTRLTGTQSGPRQPVALVLQDSPECLAAFFGIWPPGCVVIPIDARWPVGTVETFSLTPPPVCMGRKDSTVWNSNVQSSTDHANGGGGERERLDGFRRATARPIGIINATQCKCQKMRLASGESGHKGDPAASGHFVYP